MKLSRLTAGYGIYIVVSASFMLQVNLWLISTVGNPFLRLCFWTASFFVLMAVIGYAHKVRLPAYASFAAVGIFALAFLLGTRQRYFEEKTHILMYGILGFLAARDAAAHARPKPRAAVAAAVFVCFVSACDEFFQLILPYRFGEINDFITNVLGGMLGICLCFVLRVGR